MAQAGEMTSARTSLTIVVAATPKHGIGKNGTLPWPMIKKDMAYFASVTKRVPMSIASTEPSAKNVVIMGRKTWESIPKKLRPLKERTNIVISSQDRTQLQPLPEDVIVASDILSGIKSLETLVREGRAPPMGRTFVMGGTSIYKAALDLPQLDHILLTRIGKEYDCDTFFPEFETDGHWRRADHAQLQSFVGEEVDDGPRSYPAGEEEIELDFQLYEKSR